MLRSGIVRAALAVRKGCAEVVRRREGLLVAALAMSVAGCVGSGPGGRTMQASTNDAAGQAQAAGVGAAKPVLRLVRAPATVGAKVPVVLTQEMARQALRSGVLAIDLGDGTRYEVRMEGARPEAAGRWTAIGRVQTRVGLQAAVLTFGPDAVFGVLPRPDGRSLAITTTRGITSIGLAGGLVPEGHDSLASSPDFVLPRPVADGTPTAQSGSWSPNRRPPMPGPQRSPVPSVDGPPPEVRIDLLGVYSDDLVELRGSASAAETEMTSLVSIANQAHIDSGSRIRLSLVGMKQATIPVEDINETVLYAATGNKIAGLDLQALRDQLSADLVFVLRPYHSGDPSCGIAYLNGGGLLGTDVNASSGFSVSDVDPCGPYVVAHELGHNMGSSHDRVTASANGYVQYGAYPYSFGYRQYGPPAFATVMAYQEDRPWVGYFSNPASMACGASCGVADEADNVRSLNRMAGAIAAFRGKPGTVSIPDVEVVEPLDQAYVPMRVRLSGVAPAGGVSVTLQFSDGTAKAGDDYVSYGSNICKIDAGYSETECDLVRVRGDDLVEGDETFRIRISGATGASVDDGDAVVTIVDDDPRSIVQGRIRFPYGMTPPNTGFAIDVQGIDYPNWLTHSITVSPPDFRYSVGVPKGGEAILTAHPPAPLLATPLVLGHPEGNAVVDYVLSRGYVVSGALRFPAGGPVPSDSIGIEFVESFRGKLLSTRWLYLDPPDYRFSEVVAAGTLVNIHVHPQPPYLEYWTRRIVTADFNDDMLLSTLPSLVTWGLMWNTEDSGVVGREFDRGTTNTTTIVFGLSAPATAAGASLTWRTVAGTATAGDDFEPQSGTITFAPGEKSKEVYVHTFGDDVVEGDEYFDVVAENVQGAAPEVTSVRFTLLDDDAGQPCLRPGSGGGRKTLDPCR